MESGEMTEQTLIERIKEQIAIEAGFSNMAGTHWAVAMLITHRTKRQLELYEKVAEMLELVYRNAFGKDTGDDYERIAESVDCQFEHLKDCHAN